MILTCPSCGTQYVVKDGAIPPEGRQVRCAACKHSWHEEPQVEQPLELQDGTHPVAEAEGVDEAPAQSHSHPADADVAEGNEHGPQENESLAEATLIKPRSGPEAEERAYEEAVVDGQSQAPPEPEADTVTEPPVAVTEIEPAAAAEDWNAPPDAEADSDMFSPFVSEDEEEPRKTSAMSKILIALLVIVALAVAFWFLAPADMKSRLGIASASASPLQVSNPPHVERLQLASGNELLTVSGRVINPTSREQEIPPLSAKLTNQAGKLVYSWTIAPPARSLAAGASASFNSAEVNVPPGGEYLTITLGQKA
jgi:predicted Zn finger-like uncharacterized protein